MSLHWLPLQQRINIPTCNHGLQICQLLHCPTLRYLSRLLNQYTHTGQLRSSGQHILSIPRIHIGFWLPWCPFRVCVCVCVVLVFGIISKTDSVLPILFLNSVHIAKHTSQSINQSIYNAHIVETKSNQRRNWPVTDCLCLWYMLNWFFFCARYKIPHRCNATDLCVMFSLMLSRRV